MCAARKTATRALLLLALTVAATRAAPVSEFDAAASNVTWTPCGDNFDCTRVTAPLDWSNSSDLRTVELAVGRFKATQEPYLGVIWYSPGGPGQSGSGLIYEAGPPLSLATGGQYDIISWDPRGINASSPNLTCFDTALDEYLFKSAGTGGATQKLNIPANFGGNQSVMSVSDVDAEFEAQLARKKATMGSLWSQCVAKSGDIPAFMGTLNVMKDLDYLSTLVSGPDSKINYYGVSYGTLLGQYLSVILPPSRLGRIAIDGVANADTWQSYPVAQLTEPAFADVDATILHGFGRACAAAGDACPLSSFGSAGQIVGAIHSLIDNLYFNPVPISPDLFPSGFVEPQYARELLYQIGYAPALWSTAGAAFAEAIGGNYTLLLGIIAPSVSPSVVAAASQSATYPFSVEAVMCADWRAYDASHPPPSKKEVARLIRRNLQKYSGSMGDALYNLIFCELWPSESKSRYSGPITLANNTLETPVLILTNTWDPVTPRVGAFTALKNFGFSNSRLVEQNGTAHTTFATPSACVLEIVAGFFVNGTAPEVAYTYCPFPATPYEQSA